MLSAIHDPRSKIVVIGYGNDLRGDDAVGQRVALAVARWRRPGLAAIAAHQLMPELAASLAHARLAIFVDASRAGHAPMNACVRRIEPLSTPLIRGHTADPCALLALAQLVYGQTPPAWWITIPARRFDFGADLSPEVRRGAAAALRHIRALVRAV